MSRPDPRRDLSGATPSRRVRPIVVHLRHEEGFGRETAGDHGRVVRRLPPR